MLTNLKRLEWWLYKQRKRLGLRNRSASIISDNCNAGIILHDLGLRFNTPTVNLFFRPTDFLLFLQDLPRHLTMIPSAVNDSSVSWPVGDLEGIHIHFMHYENFDQAKEKWVERAKRVDFSNLFIMMTDKNGCSYEQIRKFDLLPFKHKVILTHKAYAEFDSAYHIPGFEEQAEVGTLTDFKPGFWRRRYIDDFDYVAFLNGASVPELNAARNN